MNKHFGKDQAMSVEEAVEKGAAIFAEAEEYARGIKKGFRELRNVFAAVRDGGHIGGLEAQALACEADALATEFEAALYRMHANLTERAKEANIDLPTIESGGR